MKKLMVEPRLDKKLKEFAKKLQAVYGYSAEIAYNVAYRYERIHGNIVVVDGVARDIKPTSADGRIA